MPLDSNDWRRTGQERLLTGATFRRQSYHPPRQTWDHEHCKFCWAKFMAEGASDDPSVLAEGYVTEGDHWVCERCFADFRQEFGWTVAESD